MNNNSAVLKLAHQIRKEQGVTLKEAFQLAYKNSANIAPQPVKTTWTREELDKVFSDKVAELLKKGYTITTPHMSGSQGEIAHLDFTKDGQLYRLLMDKDIDWNNDENPEFFYYNDKVTIILGRYPENLGPYSTLWNGRLEAVWSFSCYKVTDNWFVTEELRKEFSRKHALRRASRGVKSSRLELSEQAKSIVLQFLRKQKGFKTARLSDIEQVYKTYTSDKTVYNVVAKGKVLRIH